MRIFWVRVGSPADVSGKSKTRNSPSFNYKQGLRLGILFLGRMDPPDVNVPIKKKIKETLFIDDSG